MYEIIIISLLLIIIYLLFRILNEDSFRSLEAPANLNVTVEE